MDESRRLNQIMDADGKLKNRDVNIVATWLLQRRGNIRDFIVGDALLVPAEMID